MEMRVAVVGIVVEDPDSVEKLNAILHEYSRYIIGRMGVPYRVRGISVISIALDAPNDAISSLAGRIGNLRGVSAKTAYSSVSFSE
jgi:putative iron-only hydrogenase system regulator